MSTVTILTSGYNPSQYIDQYCSCIKTWAANQSFLSQVELLFAVAYAKFDEEDAEKCKNKLIHACDLTGVNVQFIKSENENYPQTINRMLRDHVKTDYVGILNIDDWRDIDCLEKQVGVLDNGADFTFGDFVIVNDMAIIIDKKNGTPVYESAYEFTDSAFNSNRKVYQRVFKWGPFLAWKRSINDEIGFYDEKLTVAADYDFVNRVIGAGYRFKKTDGVVGAFLAIGKGLSTTPDTLGHHDNAIVHSRYFSNNNQMVTCFGKEYNNADLLNKKWQK